MKFKKDKAKKTKQTNKQKKKKEKKEEEEKKEKKISKQKTTATTTSNKKRNEQKQENYFDPNGYLHLIKIQDFENMFIFYLESPLSNKMVSCSVTKLQMNIN